MKHILSCLLVGFVAQALPAAAFKVGYQGAFPVAQDIPAVHESLTADGVRLWCKQHGLEGLKKTPLYVALFNASIESCEEITFSTDSSRWPDSMKRIPIQAILIGSRYPDLLEMAGIDSQKADYQIVKHKKQVQFESYRLFPHLHGQLSKYHNVYGGDMELAVQKWRDYIEAVFYELTALIQSTDPASPQRNRVVAAHHMYKHDLESASNGFDFEAAWPAVMLGALFHSLADSFSHNPVIVLDDYQNRLIRGAWFYGRFSDQDGQEVGIDALYHAIGSGIAQSMSNLSDKIDAVLYSVTDELDLDEITPTRTVGDNTVPNYVVAHGQKYATGYLSTTLTVYAISEFLSALTVAVQSPQEPNLVRQVLDDYLDKYCSFDFLITPGFYPVTTDSISDRNPLYPELPWYNFHFVDIWAESRLSDKTQWGKEAFVLPWTNRDSMGSLLHDEAIEERFVIMPAQDEHYDAVNRVFYLDAQKMYFFKSWYQTEAADIVRVDLDQYLFYAEGNGITVTEQEIEIDGTSQPGLDTTYAFAWVPAGYRLCLHAPPDPGSHRRRARTAAYDRNEERYRCFYGAKDGGQVQTNFHLRSHSRVYVLPIDPDKDGVPFLNGYVKDRIDDNCPFDFNPDQHDNPCSADSQPVVVKTITKSPSHGGHGGNYFDDLGRAGISMHPTSFTIRTGKRVDAIETALTNGMRLHHGGGGGGARELRLNPSENLVRVELCIGKKNGKPRVFWIKLVTNQGRSIEGGRRTSQHFTIEAPTGGRIVGFHGRSGGEIDRLGTIFVNEE